MARQQKHLNHPVTYISWDDAASYAQWLTRLSGLVWRLPTEAEWEKAARWDSKNLHARIYSWGDTFNWTVCNSAENLPAGTTPIGAYLSGSSPYGIEDMAGNVWEWTSSVYSP